MALNFFSKEKTYETKKDVIVDFPLFNNNESYEIDKVIAHLIEFWGFSVGEVEDVDNETAVFTVDGQLVAIAQLPSPINVDELEYAAEYNFTWLTAMEDLKNHTGHAIVTVLNGNKTKKERYIILSKIVCSIMMTSNCAGLYSGSKPLLLSKKYYLEFVEDLQNGDVCLPLWVYIGLRTEKLGVSFYTQGLNEFGKKEIEIINSKRDIEELYNFVLNICSYIIDCDVTFKNRDTVGYTDEHRVPVRISKGVYLLSQDTLKINL